MRIAKKFFIEELFFVKLMKILPLILLLFIVPAKTFADAPEISYGKMSFNFLKGYYTLEDNVKVSMNNHGVKMTVTADLAKVSLLQKKCVAVGNVNLTHDNIVFSCDKAFASWDSDSAEVVGNVNFNSKENITITAESATFNWKEKVADFYGKVKIHSEKNLKNDKGSYAHIRYNVEENKILQLDKKFDIPNIVIPDFDD